MSWNSQKLLTVTDNSWSMVKADAYKEDLKETSIDQGYENKNSLVLHASPQSRILCIDSQYSLKQTKLKNTLYRNCMT